MRDMEKRMEKLEKYCEKNIDAMNKFASSVNTAIVKIEKENKELKMENDRMNKQNKILLRRHEKAITKGNGKQKVVEEAVEDMIENIEMPEPVQEEIAEEDHNVMTYHMKNGKK